MYSGQDGKSSDFGSVALSIADTERVADQRAIFAAGFRNAHVANS
jgi:hypothetical protein